MSRLAILIHSIVCLAGTCGGAFLAAASIVSIADMRVPWVGLLLVAALLVPVAFIVSGVGAWLAYYWSFTRTAIGLMFLPWLYTAFFIAGMVLSFQRQTLP
jgi:hypothetical protein